jgi:hypothetical protein
MLSHKAFVEGWTLLEASFGGQAGRMQVWEERFKEWTDAEWGIAARRAADELGRFPSFKDILDRRPGHLSESEAAEAAWTRVQRKADEGPPYNPTGTVNWETRDLDPLDLEAIGGERGLQSLHEVLYSHRGESFVAGKEGLVKRDFLVRYTALARSNVKGLLPDGQIQKPAIPAPSATGELPRDRSAEVRQIASRIFNPRPPEPRAQARVERPKPPPRKIKGVAPNLQPGAPTPEEWEKMKTEAIRKAQEAMEC